MDITHRWRQAPLRYRHLLAKSKYSSPHLKKKKKKKKDFIILSFQNCHYLFPHIVLCEIIISSIKQTKKKKAILRNVKPQKDKLKHH